MCPGDRQMLPGRSVGLCFPREGAPRGSRFPVAGLVRRISGEAAKNRGFANGRARRQG
jgi:hypothetical protein